MSNSSVSTVTEASDVSHVTPEWCASRTETVEEFTYIWTIRKFAQIATSQGDLFQSPTFSTGGSLNACWLLKLYPKGIWEEPSTTDFKGDNKRSRHADDSEDTGQDMITYLCLHESCMLANVRAKFRISVMHAGGKKERPSGYDEFVDFIPGRGWRVVWRKDLFDREGHVGEDGTLVIACDVWMMIEEAAYNALDRSCRPISIPSSRITETLATMLDKNLFTDVVLSVQGKEFPAHRAVLSAQSSFFQNMFEQSKDSIHNRVLITDFSVDTVQAMLRFLYTDVPPKNLSFTAKGLLTAADKYDLHRLKAICEESLSRDLTIESAATTLILANQTSASQLRSCAIQYITVRGADVMKTDGWSSLKDHPLLLAELCQALATKAAHVKRSRRTNKVTKE